MHSFYFGNSKQPLYGVIHNPVGSAYRNSSILLCNSVGHEYIRCHRELIRLANQLAESGYYVLRFDYSGVGDSFGIFEEKNMTDWMQDIRVAQEELCAISGVQLIDCIGVRLGASLACNALHGAGVRKLLLWDPVINGDEYVNSFNQLQDEILQSPMWFQTPRDRKDIPRNEFLGYRYSPALLNQLSKEMIIDDLSQETSQLVHFYTQDNASDQKFSTELKRMHHISEFITDMGDWDKLGTVDASLTANHIINRIVQELT